MFVVGMGMNQMGGMGMGGPSMGMMAGGWDNDYYQVFCNLVRSMFEEKTL